MLRMSIAIIINSLTWKCLSHTPGAGNSFLMRQSLQMFAMDTNTQKIFNQLQTVHSDVISPLYNSQRSGLFISFLLSNCMEVAKLYTRKWKLCRRLRYVCLTVTTKLQSSNHFRHPFSQPRLTKQWQLITAINRIDRSPNEC